MAQKWYHKASVQTAIVSGVFLVIGIAIPNMFKIPKLKNKIEQLESKNSAKTAEIQRLETQLTPFKTIALEKFTGSEQEVLKKLAVQINKLQQSDIEKENLIKNLETELKKTKKLSKPNKLIFNSKTIKKTKKGYRITIKLNPSKPEIPFNNLKFSAVILGLEEKIIDFQATVSGTHYQPQFTEDRKRGVIKFTTLGENPQFKIIISAPTNLVIYGNYEMEPIEIKKEDF